MIKDVKVYLKSLKGKMVLVAAGIATGVLVMGGCTTEVVVTDPVTTEVVTENPEPEIEVIETSEPVEEVVVEDKEECELPEFILYDENGEVYVPQEVTADDIYARIDEITEKYNFANDWERDRAIGILLYNNAHYMTDEAIEEVYDEYLANFGGENVAQQNDFEMEKIMNNENKVALADYYVDTRLSVEAGKIENYIDNGDMEKYKEAFIAALNTMKEDEYNEMYYNSLYAVYAKVFTNKCDYTNEEFNLFGDYDINGCNIYYSVNNYDTLNFQISDYESSHIEKAK